MHSERKLHDRRLRTVSHRPRRDRQPAACRPAWPDWIYVGEVGTGFKERDAAYQKKTLDTLKTRTPIVPLKGKNYVFAQPTLIAEIEFRGWTDDGNLRHASYEGLREIKDNAAVYELD